MHSKHIFEGGFGLERETLRVDGEGRLAKTPHPFNNKYLERDFCENQLEIITPVCGSVEEAVGELSRLSDYAEETLWDNGEYLWINSNPPYIEDEDEIPVARFEDEKEYKTLYRHKLEQRYGKRLMLYSGIHFNYSLSEEYLYELYDGKEDFKVFKNNLYLRLFKYASRYSWLMVLLTSASPIYDKSLADDGLYGTGFDGYSSRRNGENGYWNCFIPKLDYGGLREYAKSVKKYIDRGILFSAGELYLPVRLKPRGENSLEALVKNGADHIELRMFDLNPLSSAGVAEEDLKFAHYFLLYLLSLPDFEFTYGLQVQAIANHKAAAGFDPGKIRINGYPAVQAALGIIDDMEFYFGGYKEVLDILDFQRSKLISENRYSNIIYQKFKNDFWGDFLTFTLTRGGCKNVRTVGSKLEA